MPTICIRMPVGLQASLRWRMGAGLHPPTLMLQCPLLQEPQPLLRMMLRTRSAPCPSLRSRWVLQVEYVLKDWCRPVIMWCQEGTWSMQPPTYRCETARHPHTFCYKRSVTLWDRFQCNAPVTKRSPYLFEAGVVTHLGRLTQCW